MQEIKSKEKWKWLWFNFFVLILGSYILISDSCILIGS